MLIDWFTVGAQIINLLILTGLLKRFLYQPIIKAIDAREKHIAKELEAARQSKEQAEDEYQQLVEKNKAFDSEREQQWQKVQQDLSLERQKLLKHVHEDVEHEREHWQKALNNEQRRFSDTIIKSIQLEVFAIVKKVLHELANADIEALVLETFLSQADSLFQALDKHLLSNAADNHLLIKTAFDVSAKQRQQIEKAIERYLKQSIEAEFNIDKSLISGIELIFNGQKMSWCVADYLESLQQNVDTVLQRTENGLTYE